eukprot:scaffold1333_cov130-Skeletonema_dohrnii-CCMP3373.AAC.18
MGDRQVWGVFRASPLYLVLRLVRWSDRACSLVPGPLLPTLALATMPCMLSLMELIKQQQ